VSDTSVQEEIISLGAKFQYSHLPEYLHPTAHPFYLLAVQIMAMDGDRFQVRQCLWRLLEAKDCAVRAALQ
jgi:hypothetical protein